MSYSNSVPEWAGSATTSNQYGWMGQIWTALTDNTSEPDIDDITNWQLDTPLQFTGFGLVEIPDPKDFLKVYFTGFGIEEEHINRPPEVKFFGFGIEAQRNKPYLIINSD